MKISHKRTVLSGIVFWLIMAFFSYILNEVVTGEAHDAIGFFRPETKGKYLILGLTCMIWGILNAYGYRLFSERIKIKSPTLKGLFFGLIVFFLYVFLQESIIYIFIDFPASIVIAGLIHYLISFTLGYIIIANFHRGKNVKS